MVTESGTLIDGYKNLEPADCQQNSKLSEAFRFCNIFYIPKRMMTDLLKLKINC